MEQSKRILERNMKRGKIEREKSEKNKNCNIPSVHYKLLTRQLFATTAHADHVQFRNQSFGYVNIRDCGRVD